MINQAELKVGDKVYYQPPHMEALGEYENGIVKEIPEHTFDAVRVVYNCAGNWENFRNYTSALTELSDLYLGWHHR
jgi:hypothetical protein